MPLTALSIFAIFLVQSYFATEYLYMELINQKTQTNTMFITEEEAYGSFTFSMVNPTSEVLPIHYGKPEPYRLNGPYNVTGFYFMQPRMVPTENVADLKWEDPKKEWIFVLFPADGDPYWAAFPARPGMVFRPNDRYTWLLSGVKIPKDYFMFTSLNDNIVANMFAPASMILYNYSLLFLPGTPSLNMSVTAYPTTLAANKSMQSVVLTFHNPMPNSRIPAYTLGNEYLHSPQFEIDFYDIIPPWTGFQTGTQQQTPIYQMRWLIQNMRSTNMPNPYIVSTILPSNGFKKRDGEEVDQRSFPGFFLTEAGTQYDTINITITIGIKPVKPGRGKIVIRSTLIHQTVDTNIEVPITIQ